MTLTQRDLKKQLKMYSKDALIRDIGVLFKKFDNVQDYYRIKFSGQPNTDVPEKYKKVIKNEFTPARGLPRIHLSVARKAVRDYKKLNPNTHLLIELMLFYVECGIECTLTYGDIDENFYNSMEGMFYDACALIKKNELIEKYFERCLQAFKRVEGKVGWGFADGLYYALNRNFNYHAPNRY